MNRHRGIEWAQVQAKLQATAKRLWSLNEMWREPAVNRTLLAMITTRENTFIVIVQRKALKAEEVFVTTVKPWSPEKNISRKTVLWIWQLTWVLRF